MNMDLNSMRALKKEKGHRKVEVRVLVVAVASMMAREPQAKEKANLNKGRAGQADFWSQAVVRGTSATKRRPRSLFFFSNQLFPHPDSLGHRPFLRPYSHAHASTLPSRETN